MRRYSPEYYSPPRRSYGGGRGRSPPRKRGREQNNRSLLVRNIPLDCRPEELRSPVERFGLFLKGQLGIKFKPYSKYPPCYKDVSFWINESFTENNLCEVVRKVAGDLVEEVQLIDNFTNKKRMTRHCYRITYRSMERSLTDDEINKLHVFYMQRGRDISFFLIRHTTVTSKLVTIAYAGYYKRIN